MEIETKAFGEVKVSEEDILTFVGPILGFENIKRYVVLYDQDNPGPFFWLQAVEQPEPAFVVMEPQTVVSSYQPTLSDADMEAIELESLEDLRLLVIVRIPNEVKDISANFKSPVIINGKKSLAKQVVLEDRQYPIRYYLVPKTQGGEAHAGAEQKKR